MDDTERGRRPQRRALAFDWGLRHIGVAAGQTRTGTAQPVTTLKAKDGIPDWERLGALLDEWDPDVVVVGLPLDLDGSDGEMCPGARRFGRRIAGRFSRIVEFQDERLTTREAFSRGAGHKDTHDLAATIILEDWLRAQR